MFTHSRYSDYTSRVTNPFSQDNPWKSVQLDGVSRETGKTGVGEIPVSQLRHVALAGSLGLGQSMALCPSSLLRVSLAHQSAGVGLQTRSFDKPYYRQLDSPSRSARSRSIACTRPLRQIAARCTHWPGGRTLCMYQQCPRYLQRLE